MPRYHFDVTDGTQVTIDRGGTDLADDDEAREEAIGLCLHLSRALRPTGDGHELKVEARDARGMIVYEATMTLDGRWWPGRR